MVFEYEIYQERKNAPLFVKYNDRYKVGFGVPMMIAGNGKLQHISGDYGIIKYMDDFIERNRANEILLPTKKVKFDKLNFSEMPGFPKVWYKTRMAAKQNAKSIANDSVRKFLLNGEIPENAIKSKNKTAQLSGNKIKFEHAVESDGWLFMY